MTIEYQHKIDITAEICPMTFVKTKLKVESMAKGDVCLVRLKGAEPLENVPRSLLDLGHEILSLEMDQEAPDKGVYRLLFKKC